MDFDYSVFRHIPVSAKVGYLALNQTMWVRVLLREPYYCIMTLNMPYKDPKKHLKFQREWRAKRRAKLAEIKNVPCVDCGGKFPHYVMDFDHGDEEKLFKIASDLNNVSWDEILAEIAKCDIICSNCHRIRSYKAKHHIAVKWR